MYITLGSTTADVVVLAKGCVPKSVKAAYEDNGNSAIVATK